MMMGYKTSVRKCPVCDTHLEMVEQNNAFLRYQCPSCTNEAYLVDNSDVLIENKVFNPLKTCLFRNDKCRMVDRGGWEKVGQELHLIMGCWCDGCNGRNIRVIL